MIKSCKHRPAQAQNPGGRGQTLDSSSAVLGWLLAVLGGLWVALGKLWAACGRFWGGWWPIPGKP